MKIWVWVVVHEMVSHDMFVTNKQLEEPKVFGVYSSEAKAKVHIRENMDDYMVQRRLELPKERVVKKKKVTSGRRGN